MGRNESIVVVTEDERFFVTVSNKLQGDENSIASVNPHGWYEPMTQDSPDVIVIDSRVGRPTANLIFRHIFPRQRIVMLAPGETKDGFERVTEFWSAEKLIGQRAVA